MEKRWLLAVLAVALVANALAFVAPFINFDDGYYVVHNWKMNAPGVSGLAAIWSLDDIGPNKSIEFFPLRDSVYWLLFKAFGANPLPFHVANVAFHLATCALVLALGRRLFPPAIAGWGALLFAAHPIHVESIHWVSGLKDPMFSMFTLLSLVAFCDWREKGGARRYATVLLAFAAALSCKSLALGAPVVMLAIDRALAPAPRWSESLRRVAAPAAIAGVALVCFVLIGRAAGVLTPPHGGNWGAHSFFSAWAFVRYVQQALVPYDFRLLYCFGQFGGLGDVRWLGVLALVGGASVLALRGRPRWAVAIGATWFVAFLLPVLNVMPFPTLMNDRYLYLPVAAACWALAGALSLLPAPTGARLSVLLVVAFTALSLFRGLDWLDEYTLFSEVTDDPVCAVDGSPPVATMMVRTALMLEQEPDRQFALYRRVADHPGFLRNDREVQCQELLKIARSARTAHRPEDALFFAQRVTQGCPEYLAGWQVQTQAALSLNPALARDAAARAYQLEPSNAARFFLGLAKVAAGEDGAAEVEAAVRQNPAEVCPHLRAFPARPELAAAAKLCGG